MVRNFRLNQNNYKIFENKHYRNGSCLFFYVKKIENQRESFEKYELFKLQQKLISLKLNLFYDKVKSINDYFKLKKNQ